MKTIFILLALFFTACGQDEAYLKSDPELDYYLRWYLRVAPTDGALKELATLEFGTPPEGKVGYCEVMPIKTGYRTWSRTRAITVKKLNRDGFLAAVVMHELAHCLHDFEHEEAKGHLMSDPMDDDAAWWDANIQTELERLWQ